MSEFRTVTPTFAVSPQIALEDVTAAKAAGFMVIIDNRPDGEAPDQAASAMMEEAARAAGLEFAFIPVVGRPTPEQAAAVQRAASGRKTLAYCRSGTRSILAWALGELASGNRSRDELLRLAAGAGYDLSASLPG